MPLSVTRVGRTEEPRCLFHLAREHREARESARCRGTGASSGTADFDSSGKLSALCVRRGFPTPLYSARRAPDVPSGVGGGQGKEREIPSPHPFRRRSPTRATRVSRHSLRSPARNRSSVPMTTRVRFIPSPLTPCRPSLSSHPDAPSRAHAPPGASWQQVSDPALRSAACPESRTDTEIETGRSI